MGKISRRDFMKFSLLGLGGLLLGRFLAACGWSPVSTAPSSSPTNITAGEADTSLPSPNETSQAPDETTAGTPEPIPDIAVARGGEPEALVRAAIGALGGMGRFVLPRARVIVKPNICVGYRTYEYAATTNPWVVGALVKLCFEAGADKVSVLDYPFGGTADECYTNSGIREQVEAAGGEMVNMPAFKFVATPIPEGKDLRKVEIFDDILKADVLINVPIAKHHELAILSLAMKNLMGVINNRGTLHGNIGQRLADLASVVRPTLNVIDAVRILTAHGPTGGHLEDVRKLDTVIASQDIVAADSYASTLFGFKPEDLSFIQAGTAMGLGRSDLQNLYIKEIEGN